MVLDTVQPKWDARKVESRVLPGGSEAIYRAILNSDFLDAARCRASVKVLFAVRAGIERLVSALLRKPQVVLPEPASLKLADIPPHGGWIKLGENSPVEIAFGAIGRCWEGETVWQEIDARDFAAFQDYGFAKVACHFLIEPFAEGKSRVSYEVRTVATDPASRRAFLRYWRFVSPLAGTIMRAMLSVVADRLAQEDQCDTLLDRFIPQYDVAERHSIRVSAPAKVTFGVAREMDLQESKIVGAIFKARELILRSGPRTGPLTRGIVEQTKALGWEVLAEIPGREIVMGAITQPWLPSPVFRGVQPGLFAAHHEPGYVKIAWTLRADPLNDAACIFRTETRVAACDLDARSKFHRYWRFFSAGIILIRVLMLPLVKKEAEQRARSFSRDIERTEPARHEIHGRT